ncbi:MAG: hypothetical protein UT26_C0008G0002 [Microgenomates group bacterium GW2011_GWC1_39_12]|nr:MAG: hypothetical protein UT26_C0008G0002 [Microgenomates group bacterium GW2011_GWC1_39_12]
MTNHQDRQREVIDQIEKEVQENKLTFSTVEPVSDFDNDTRVCLTSLHFPKEYLVGKIYSQIIQPLQRFFSDHYFYSKDMLHMTIKNIRVMRNPPSFTDADVSKVERVFTSVVPRHVAFNVYFYRLLLFPTNLALIGTTDLELDNLVLDLDRKLKENGVADDKIYINKRYFFSNMTLVRFTKQVEESFREEVMKISSQLQFEPYMVDSVTLVQGNASLHKKKIINTWMLQSI